jgi:hypothetical protein
MATPSGTPRVFVSKPFMRFARSFGIGDREIWDTVNGACDADLGGGVFKYRLARQGEGSSGGARALIAMKAGKRAVLIYGFEKKGPGKHQARRIEGVPKSSENLSRLQRGRDFRNRERESSH